MLEKLTKILKSIENTKSFKSDPKSHKLMKIRPKTANRQKKQKFKTIDPKSRKTTKIHGYFQNSSISEWFVGNNLTCTPKQSYLYELLRKRQTKTTHTHTRTEIPL